MQQKSPSHDPNLGGLSHKVSHLLLELTDREEARRYLLQGFCRQSVAAPAVETVVPVLEWALEISAGGEPLPPIGFVADVGHLVLGHPGERSGFQPAGGWPASLVRAYEDSVLGKLDADASFERGAAGVCRFRGRDRARGLAFLVNAIRQRSGFGGAMLSPAVIKSLMRRPDDFLSEAWDSAAAGLLPVLPQLYGEIVASVRSAGSVLAMEDVFELEHGTALAPLGERLALRQVLQAAAVLEQALPPPATLPQSRQREVAANLLAEDTYPVGGFSSISTRGSVESLLHSQLAFMDPDGRPDLFDLKFLRDELLYYARDENQFLRRRLRFVFALFPDLLKARVKDAELPWQRAILALGLIVATVRRLTECLGSDSLVFGVTFLFDDEPPLNEERRILERVFRDPIASGTVEILELPVGDLKAHCGSLAKRSLTQLVMFSTTEQDIAVDNVAVHRLQVGSPPRLDTGDERSGPLGESALDAWCRTAAALVSRLSL